MIRVHNKSRAESTIEAMSDSEEDETTAAIFATSRKIFAMTFIFG
jgi:hypothetical protein